MKTVAPRMDPMKNPKPSDSKQPEPRTSGKQQTTAAAIETGNGAHGAESLEPRMKKKVTRLFGTDGIRGVANRFPMTPDVILKVGQALGFLLRQQHQGNRRSLKVLIGKDTRLSGYMVEQALSSGLNSMGVDVQLVGPLPTPGIGFLALNMRANAGIVISASHNAFQDNGIKIFGPDGFKIPDTMEREIEKLVADDDLIARLGVGEHIGRSRRIDDSAGRYVVFVKNTFPNELTLDGMRIVLDCANGAAYKVAPAVFEELGAEVMVVANEPNGLNINDKSGALYPMRMAEEVLRYRADVGICLDGDGDRVVMADAAGQIANGDHLLAICAIHLKEAGALAGNTVVATQMSNFGLEVAMKSHGIHLLRAEVGDKNVVEEMRRGGFVLGGEQSGHIIFLNHATTGDGLIAALKVLSVMRASGKTLAELRSCISEVPQVLVNIRVGQREELQKIQGYTQLIEDVARRLKGDGRIFVRYSGTEPLVRILVEGSDERKIAQLAEEVALFLQKKIG